MPGVFLSRGAYRPGPRSPAPSSRAYDVMDFSLRCGAQLMARGAAAVDVESAVHAAAVTLGLDEVEVDVTYNAITLTAVDHEQAVAASRVTRQGAPDYRRLTQIHQLLTDVVAAGLALGLARAELERIESQPRSYGLLPILLANGVLAGAVALSLGAGWLVAGAAALTGVVIIWLGHLLASPRIPAFFLAAGGSLIAVGAAAGLTALEAPVRPSLVVAASIVVLLPSVSLVGSVRDALVGFPLTATGRAVDGIVLVAGLVTGVLIALSIAGAVSVDMEIVPVDEGWRVDIVLRALAGSVAAAAAAVVYQAPRSLLPAALVIGGLGFLVARGVDTLVDQPILALGSAAVVVGAAAGLAAARTRTLSLVFVVPGIIPLLPGLAIYRGSLLLSAGDTVEGLVVLLDAAVRMMALAAGALFGEILVSGLRGGGQRTSSTSSGRPPVS